MIRLDKYLAASHIGSRSEVKKLIKKGLVKVDEKIITTPELKVDPGRDKVYVQGKPVNYKEHRYYMLNKPENTVSANEDNLHRTVFDCLNVEGKDKLFCVGRLDIDTRGLLIITDDGELSHRLTSPVSHVAKTYTAIVLGEVTEDDVESFERGISITEEGALIDLKPAGLELKEYIYYNDISSDKRKIVDERYKMRFKSDPLDNPKVSLINLTITEGKFHQVKRMFEKIGKYVLYLERISMGKLTLDKALSYGDYRELTDDEISLLRDNSRD